MSSCGRKCSLCQRKPLELGDPKSNENKCGVIYYFYYIILLFVIDTLLEFHVEFFKIKITLFFYCCRRTILVYLMLCTNKINCELLIIFNICKTFKYPGGKSGKHLSLWSMCCVRRCGVRSSYNTGVKHR